ncbi:acyl-phosphate glycerol 3-phosphate acyltransferase [Glaciecola punicea]|uniref:1-acylglycerol-3-phosphate O-acyltransferase n=1 Tax=Glaciecola punicea TaxID=56804 RepID=UPI00087289A3|nr:1-acylglycerol-3-phosphate O-acyltransferase [Glaciecola punicea]OFA30486.1 acyl-phosphate glycerol 3-phosphate acyltransferase [Glaciecola punicea]
MLAFVRFIVIFIYFILMNLGLIIYFIARPMHRDSVHVAGKYYSTMAKLIGVTLVYRDSSEVDTQQSYVFIGNHQNNYDLLTISQGARKGVVTVGKKSLKWVPIFGLIYWLSGNIMIDRKNTGKARDTLSLTGEKMRERNLSVWMFPEGTRSRGKGLLPFKTGAFRLALSQNKDIVPVVCSELDNGKIKLNRWNNGVVIVESLDPVKLDHSKSAKQTAKQFQTIMQNAFERLSQEAASLSK